jgi:hypothetical protein
MITGIRNLKLPLILPEKRKPDKTNNIIIPISSNASGYFERKKMPVKQIEIPPILRVSYIAVNSGQ